MAESIATYIALPGTTEAAFRHWYDVLGGDLHIQKYREVELTGMPFTPDPEAVAHAVLITPAGRIAGGDAMDSEGEYAVRGTAYSLLYTADSVEGARAIIDGLATGGGEIGMPFEIAPWGGWYGQVFDRFGVMWALSVEA